MKFRIAICGICLLGCTVLIGCGPKETELQRWVYLQKQKLPLQVDQNTDFVDCQAGENEVIYIYEVHGVSESEFSKVTESVRMSVLGNIEVNRSELTDLIDAKIVMTFVYRTRTGKELYRFSVKPGE